MIFAQAIQETFQSFLLIKNNQGHKNMLNSIVCQPISSQKHYNNLCRDEDIEKQPPCIKIASAKK